VIVTTGFVTGGGGSGGGDDDAGALLCATDGAGAVADAVADGAIADGARACGADGALVGAGVVVVGAAEALARVATDATFVGDPPQPAKTTAITSAARIERMTSE
jgi:hypothetical protein